MHRLLFIRVLMLWVALSGQVVRAQEQPELLVTLHDVAGTPLVGVNVIVRDASGTRDLERAATDGQGVASFAHLSDRAVRVAVVGTLPNGTRLYQPGNDATGVSLWLDAGPVMLDLRSAADGMVVPDPATMTALEPGVPIATAAVAFPTAPIAAPIPAAQPNIPSPVVAPMVEAAPMTGAETPPAASAPTWLGVVALALLLAAGIGIVVVQRRAA
jgi:hypothetical protein